MFSDTQKIGSKVKHKMAEKLNQISDLETKIFSLEQKLKIFETWVPPGHFYSPLPDLDKVKLREKEIFSRDLCEIPGIDLNEEGQLKLFNELKRYYKEQPFKPNKNPDLRYFFENPNYSYTDAIVLHCMIRHLKPKKIIEIGAGFSSCVILDTNELFFNNEISCTFVEPYPELLKSLLKKGDDATITIMEKNLQDVDISTFKKLESNDILFIDSSHVSKINSDVNRIMFEILPSINSGVYIHFHDIFYPFEYPKEWIYGGKAWNEAYLLRAFLQYNNIFKIQLFITFLTQFHIEEFLEMSECMKNLGGNFWIKKI